MLLIGVLLKTKGDPHYDPVAHKIDFNFSRNKLPEKAVIAFSICTSHHMRYHGLHPLGSHK